jgi:molecular chaperone HtpG
MGRSGKPAPYLEGSRGIEVLLLTDQVDNFWGTSAPSFEGKPFKSVTQGAADLVLIPSVDAKDKSALKTNAAAANFLVFIKATLGEEISDVGAADRLMDSAVCGVAPDHTPDRQLEKLLAGAGRIKSAVKPILEV